MSIGVPTESLSRPLRLPRRMAATDAVFWYAESALPTLRPIIGGVLRVDRTPDWRLVEASYEAALALIPRLRQRVVEVPLHLGLPEWVEDPHMDLAYHARRLSLPEPGTWRQLLDLLATLLATPLDPERPLWEAYWVEGLAGGRAAFFLKLHHALVDGVGSVAILNALTQRNRGGEPPRLSIPEREQAQGVQRGSLARVVDLAVDQVRHSARLSRQVAAAPARLLAHPADGANRVWRAARGLRGVVQELAHPKVVDPIAQPASGLSRRLDVLELPLERLSRIKGTLGVTLNDLVLATLAGALGAYHRERRVRVKLLNCMVPMSLRGRDEPDRLGTIRIALPVAERRPQRRLRLVSEQTGAAKRDRRGAAIPFLVQPLTLLPAVTYRWLARQLLGAVNVCCTNVQGVGGRRYIAGAAIEAMIPFVSVAEGMPLAMALCSYDGKLELGIDTDPEAIPDPHRIRELFEQGLDEMEALSSRAFERRQNRPARKG